MKRGRDIEGSELNRLIEEFDKTGVQRDRMSNDDLALIYEVCNTKDYMVWLSDHTKLKPLFINRAGRQFYGFPSEIDNPNGVELFTVLSHPDHLNGIHKFIAFFGEHPKGLFKMTNKIRCASGIYKLVYSEERALDFDKFGNARHLLSIVYDIDQYLEGKHLQPKTEEFKNGLILYNSLTPREHEILDLVAAEMSSQEIGDQLNIEASTVNTHRKNLLKKLNLKSSLGLVKHSIRYSNGGIFT